ncbi:hypothetical protein D3C78_1485650 [compost metagenome]
MFSGLRLAARKVATSTRICSALSSAHGSEPSPPASATAIASAEPLAPAIGAWMIGSSMPSRSRIRVSGHVLIDFLRQVKSAAQGGR